jgi:histidinol phosphatase-like PHP family hydrolase
MGMFIDLHTHSLFSDGILLPSELVYHAKNAHYKAIAITDHVDCSNYDFVIPRIIKIANVMSKIKNLGITVIPGVEITYVPPEIMPEFVRTLRKTKIKLIVAHGETSVEPVPEGTNCAAIKAKVDILAHPGNISLSDAILAKKNGVYLEITTRKGHRKTNKHVFDIAKKVGNSLIINTDTHLPEDLLDKNKIEELLNEIGCNGKYEEFLKNSEELVSRILKSK